MNEEAQERPRRTKRLDKGFRAPAEEAPERVWVGRMSSEYPWTLLERESAEVAEGAGWEVQEYAPVSGKS